MASFFPSVVDLTTIGLPLHQAALQAIDRGARALRLPHGRHALEAPIVLKKVGSERIKLYSETDAVLVPTSAFPEGQAAIRIRADYSSVERVRVDGTQAPQADGYSIEGNRAYLHQVEAVRLRTGFRAVVTGDANCNHFTIVGARASLCQIGFEVGGRNASGGRVFGMSIQDCYDGIVERGAFLGNAWFGSDVYASRRYAIVVCRSGDDLNSPTPNENSRSTFDGVYVEDGQRVFLRPPQRVGGIKFPTDPGCVSFLDGEVVLAKIRKVEVMLHGLRLRGLDRYWELAERVVRNVAGEIVRGEIVALWKSQGVPILRLFRTGGWARKPDGGDGMP